VARRPQDVTEAELGLLRALWERGEQTVRELALALYGAAGNSECATVQKLGDRLARKRLVTLDRRRRPLVLKARADRDDLLDRRLKALAEDLAAGRFAPLVSQLLRGGRFSEDELQELRQELERLEGGGAP